MDLNELLAKKRCIHFIGIGGSGIFPLVQLLHGQGHTIQGSDKNHGDAIDAELAMGITVYIGHRAGQINGADLIVYSAAIAQDNPELAAARERGVPVFERATLLGWISGRYRDCVCISGSHGKTSATALLTQILVCAGLDPTAIIGGKLPLIGGSGRAGASSIIAVEACEYKDTFLRLRPAVAVVLNVDADHLEYFGSLDGVVRSFRKFAALASRLIIANGDDENTRRALAGLDTGAEIVTFGFGPENDYTAANIKALDHAHTAFDLVFRGETLAAISLRVPGRHNILNALAACAAALAVGASPNQIEEAVPGFRGAARRFDILGKVRGVTIADDYAHHPAELAATLNTAAAMGYNKVWAVFQPFTYSRTKLLLDDFAAALAIPQRVVMSPIMGGREENAYGIHTRDLAEKIPGAVWLETFGEIADYVMKNAEPGDLVITLGCGDIYKCAKMMINRPLV